ncbi:MAG: 4Fe-4S binding protein [Atopobiaceae bacterium]|nr:4Fe-4S binding protein [Atopobiaceae bacterium]
MAKKKRDLLDEIIDIQNDWNALQHTGDDLVSQLTADPADEVVYNPDDYRERPRANSIYCATGVMRNVNACRRCLDVCPVNAITISGATVRVGDGCLRCGLCVAACPTEVFQIRGNAPLALYDKIARVATAYEQCYVTCTHALDRRPEPNEVLLPCVGIIAPEVWFSLLVEFPNLSVYLPLGICDECETTTGEETYCEAIAAGEEWSGESVGYEVDERDLGREQKRAYKRSQFVSSMTQAGTRLVSRTTPVLAGAQAVANRLKAHSQQITAMQQALDRTVATQGPHARRRVLTRKRRLLMGGLQRYPDLADEMRLEFPMVDAERCTMCGDCEKACTVHALQIDDLGRVHIEQPYCVCCGACAAVCAEDAIRMSARTCEELVVPDEEAEKRARQRARASKARAKSKQTLQKGLDMLEGLADD